MAWSVFGLIAGGVFGMNKTAQDAFERIQQAKISSLAYSPTLEYLDALERELAKWAQEIKEFRAKKETKREKLERLLREEQYVSMAQKRRLEWQLKQMKGD